MDTPKPGDFLIGSPESRAAARAILVARQSEEHHCGACFLAGLGASDGGDPNDRKFLNNPHMEWRDGWWRYKHLTPDDHVRLFGFVGCGLKMAVGSSFWTEGAEHEHT